MHDLRSNQIVVFYLATSMYVCMYVCVVVCAYTAVLYFYSQDCVLEAALLKAYATFKVQISLCVSFKLLCGDGG